MYASELDREYVAIIILALVSLIIALPLFLSSGLIASYDIFFHVVWSEQFHKAFMEGVLYPRWVDTPFGYGSPTFIFYAPLSFYVISAIHFLINSHFLSVKIAIYLSFFLSGLNMYFFAKSPNGDRAGIATAVAYQLIPYHISELFMRGSVASLFAFIWFPLILLFIRKIFTDRKVSSIVYLSFAFACLIMTHLVSAFMFSFVMIGYGLYLFVVEKKKGLLKMFFAMVLGISLSSVYLMPVIFERHYVHIEAIKIFDYRNNFLFMYERLTKEPLNRIAIMDILFLIISFALIRKKLLTTKNIFFVALLAVSLFLTIPVSFFVWRFMPGFPYLQFPWRWLAFSGFSVSIVAGSVVINSKGKMQKIIKLLLLMQLLLSFSMILKPFPLADIDFWRTQSVAFSPFEYRPIWLKEPRTMLSPVERVKVIKGDGTANIVEWKSSRRILLTNGKTSLRVRFSTLYYPGWVAKIDGRERGIMIGKDRGSMVMEVSEGRHTIELIFEDTRSRIYGKFLSAISLISVLAFFAHGMLNSRKAVTGVQ